MMLNKLYSRMIEKIELRCLGMKRVEYRVVNYFGLFKIDDIFRIWIFSFKIWKICDKSG